MYKTLRKIDWILKKNPMILSAYFVLQFNGIVEVFVLKRKITWSSAVSEEESNVFAKAILVFPSLSEEGENWALLHIQLYLSQLAHFVVFLKPGFEDSKVERKIT